MQPISPTNLITSADLYNYAPELQSYFNTFSGTNTLSGVISQATRTVLSICQVKGFDYREYTDEGQAWIDSEGNLTITAEAFPVTAPGNIIAVNLIKGGFSAALTLTDQNNNVLYQTPDPGWRFVFPNSYFYLTGTYLAGGSSQLLTLKGAHVLYNMQYMAGYQNGIPDDIKRACVLLVRDIVKDNYNPFGATSFRQGQRSETWQLDATGKSPLFKQAERILYGGGYVRVAQY
jgi:hypothetical protein